MKEGDLQFSNFIFYTLKEHYVTLWSELVLQAQLARAPHGLPVRLMDPVRTSTFDRCTYCLNSVLYRHNDRANVGTSKA